MSKIKDKTITRERARRSAEQHFANSVGPDEWLDLKAWINGVHHGVGPQHLQAYLNEFVFRFNRRFYPFTSFRSLLGIAGGAESPTYAELFSGECEHPGASGHG